MSFKSLKGDYTIRINNNCKIPTDCKVHKLAARLDHTANFDNWHNWDLMEVDTVGNLVDSHPVHHTVLPEIVVATDRARSDRCCTGMKIVNPRTEEVAHLIDQFSLSLEVKNRCNINIITFFIISAILIYF